MATNIAEFISVLRRIRDEIHPDIEATYASALVLKQAIDTGTISLNEDLAQFAIDYQNFLTKYNTIDTKVTSATNSANSAEDSALLASQKASEIQGITAVATTIAEGFPANVSYNSASGEFTFGIPVGNTGKRGEKGDSFAVNSSGLTAEKTLYDNRLKGWSFLDLTLKLLYFKLSDTNADWSTGFPFGKGDTGNGIEEIVFVSTTDASGLPAKSGATDTYRINYTDTTFDTFNVYNGLDLDVVVDDNGNIGSGAQSFNGFGGSGFKNKIINGNFDIWQRGTSFSATGFTADRWFITAPVNSQRISLSPAETDLTGAAYALRFNAGTYISYRIEDVRTLAGKKATLSFWSRSGASKTLYNLYIRQYFGTGGSTPVDTPFSSTTFNNTTGLTKHTFTVTLPTIASKTIGSDNTHYIEIFFDSQNDGIYTDITGAQLEEGSIATPFENRPYGLELSLCQRYYQKIAWSDRKTATASGQYLHQSIRLPVDMRVTPTAITNISAGLLSNALFTGSAAMSNIHFSAEGVSLAAGDSYILNRVDSLSAEL